MILNFRKGVLSVLTVLALAATACGDADVDAPVDETPTNGPTDGETSPSPDETQSPDGDNGDDIAWATCEHPEGIRVSYPEGWHVNSGETMPACSAFDPEPFDVPEATEFFGAAALLSVEQVDFETITSPDARMGRRLNERDQLIDGQDALRIETESEGDAMFPAGMRSTRWLVLLGESRTLTLTTHQVEGADYERNRQVLDQMATRLELPNG
ncbi:MAG TPA: hypothetical protein VM754_04890 [Actinomycetota bacterium]|nr:hypothetical protein [Actinomycetota bacterium]